MTNKLFKRVFLVLFLSFFALVGCAGSLAEVIHTNINGYAYNSISNSYHARPTEVRMTSDRDRLSIIVSGYGKDENGVLVVDRNDVDETVAAIDKYLEWESIAKERGDVIKKNIDEVGGQTYAIIGVAPGNHFFLSHIPIFGSNLKANSVGLLSVLLPRHEVIEFRKLLIEFKEGTLGQVDMSVYN